MLRSNSKSLGNHVVSSEKKERLQWEGFAEKEGCSPRLRSVFKAIWLEFGVKVYY